MHQGKQKNATDLTHSIKIVVLSHNSTLILIESGYCYFYQKPQYFWAFHVLRPISDAPGTGLFCVYAVFRRYWQELGSLDYWVVRWIIVYSGTPRKEILVNIGIPIR